MFLELVDKTQRGKERFPFFLYCSMSYFRIGIQLFRERLSEKNVHATIPKGSMGYDQYTVPDTVTVELSFVAFL